MDQLTTWLGLPPQLYRVLEQRHKTKLVPGPVRISDTELVHLVNVSELNNSGRTRIVTQLCPFPCSPQSPNFFGNRIRVNNVQNGKERFGKSFHFLRSELGSFCFAPS